jgi:lipopolysaccharide export system protein LptA
MRRDHHFMPLVLALAASLTMALSTIAVPASAAAQPAAPGNTPSAVQGFSKNSDQPVKIDAATLEVRDKDKVATFSGNVHVIQGDTHLRCQTLVVFYEGETSPGGGTKPAPKSTMVAAQPGPEGQQRIKRLEARGGVTVTQNDQVASGDTGLFDMKENTVTLTGNVLVSQGPNVTKGDRLIVNLTTGTSRIESAKGGTGRIQAVITPGSTPGGKKDGAAPAPAPAAKPTARDAAKPPSPPARAN